MGFPHCIISNTYYRVKYYKNHYLHKFVLMIKNGRIASENKYCAVNSCNFVRGVV